MFQILLTYIYSVASGDNSFILILPKAHRININLSTKTLMDETLFRKLNPSDIYNSVMMCLVTNVIKLSEGVIGLHNYFNTKAKEYRKTQICVRHSLFSI